MSARVLVLFVAIVPLLAFGASSEQEVKDRMIRDIDSLQNTFEVKYAPAEWKSRYAGWDLSTEISKTKQRIEELDDLNTKAYQRAIRQFFLSTKDYHVGVSFWSTEWAALPFRVCGAGGKYYISYIDRSRLPLRSFPFQLGDELVMFNGRPTDDVVQELRAIEVGDASPDTDQGLAEIYLTDRKGRLGHIVPSGPVIIDVRSTKMETTSSYQIMWDYNPEKIKEPVFKTMASDRESSRSPFYRKLMRAPLADVLVASYHTEGPYRDPNELGARESFIPPLGKVLWQSQPSNPFHAYLFETANRKKIGYVRIPDYYPMATGDPGDMHVNAFAEIIAYLEENSSALVIDQVNNPGGSLFYLYALVSLLSDQPLHTPKHRTTITQRDVAYALAAEELLAQVNCDDDACDVLGDTMEGYPVTYQSSAFMLHFFRFIIDEWNAGRRLTKPCYLYGVDWINPYPSKRYTKPILLLVNRLCFSGGDFLPAILQDNRRVTVFGTKTAGAGGYVDVYSYHNPFGISEIHYTASIAERIDNNPIENLGVTPDIFYDITEDDLKNNFRGYVQAVLDAVDNLTR